MSEFILPKAKKNLKTVYDRLQDKTVARFVNMEDVLFLAIGGYNRTYELIKQMGIKDNEIATFSSLNLTPNFLLETHMKKVLYITKLNYVTSTARGTSFTKKKFDSAVADNFQESLIVYKNANRLLKVEKSLTNWIKPPIVILDDQSLNLQYEGHRFKFASVGFIQMRNRNTDPYKIMQELEGVEATPKLMFSLYQNHNVDQTQLLEALDRLKFEAYRNIENEWYMKPTEFKRTVGSGELVQAMKETSELGIYQLKSNKKIGKENACWIVIPDEAFYFNGFDYKDEDEQFEEELQIEMEAEEKFEQEQEARLSQILDVGFVLNMKHGYTSNSLINNGKQSLKAFIEAVDDVEAELANGIELLESATTGTEYKHIKKDHLYYFLDGEFKDDKRLDDNYLGGKRLISIDIDEVEYTRTEIEEKLEEQGLFGLVYPTARFYFDGSKRWRVVLLSDSEMDKDSYRNTVEGVAAMLDLEIDEASKKISQLMGYPLKASDISIVIGTMVNVAQFNKQKPIDKTKVVEFSTSGKSIVDFDHKQARMLKEALRTGVPEGKRNDTYRQIIMYLRDTLKNESLTSKHEEAEQLEVQIKAQMLLDGLDDKEIEAICR